MSAALFPVLFLLAKLLQVRLPAQTPWLLIAFSALAIVGVLLLRRWRPSLPKLDLADGAFVLVALAVIVQRFWVVADVAQFPRGADAVQHAFITQLLLDHGADRTVRDTEFNQHPVEWARFFERDDAAKYLE